MKNLTFTLLLGLFYFTTINAQIQGCTDSTSFNYNPLATVDDGTCNNDTSGCQIFANFTFFCDSIGQLNVQANTDATNPYFNWTVDGNHFGTSQIIILSDTAHDICIDVTDTVSNCFSNYCESITGCGPPPCNFMVNYTFMCDTTNGTVDFTANTDVFAPTFKWLVDGVNSGTGASLNLPDSTFNVCLEVTDSSGCMIPFCQIFNGCAQPPDTTCTFNVDFTHICDSVTNDMNFTANTDAFAPMFKWLVDGVDSGSGASLLLADSSYNVCLEVTDSSGCMKPFCSFINACGTPPPCSITADYTHVCDSVNNTITFNANTNAISPNFTWVNNNTGDTLFGQTITLPDSLDYDLCLDVYDNNDGCAANTCKFTPSCGNNNPPNCTFNVDFTHTCDSVTNDMNFTANTDAFAPMFKWLVDGVDSGSGASLLLADSSYNVCLEVTDSSGCMKPFCSFINACGTPPPCSITTDFTHVCDSVNNTITFNANTNAISPNFTWVNNNTGDTLFGQTITLPDSLDYDLCLDVYDNNDGCAANTCKFTPGCGNNNPPNCAFNVDFTHICDSVTNDMNFTANTDAFAPMFKWLVDGVDSGSGASLLLADSSYNVCLEVTDSSGCMKPFCSFINACGTSPILGCMDSLSNNYNPAATQDDGSCQYDIVGCMDPAAANYNPAATIADSVNCVYPVDNVIAGCTDPAADNYDSNATDYDGSCMYADTAGVTIPGCLNPTATNYNPMANQDNGLCVYPNETTTNVIADPNVIVDTVASYPISTCVIDYTIAIDSFFITGSTLITIDLLAVDWVVWQNGNAVTISNNYVVHTDGDVLVYLVITCTTKGAATDLIALGDVVKVNRSTLSDGDISTKPKLDEYIVIYPNPVANETNISFSALKDGNVQLNVYNAIGQVVDSKNVISVNNKGNATINTSQLENGMYFVTLKDINGKIITSKFIK